MALCRGCNQQMQVVEAQAAFLSNYEVVKHLQQQREKREKLAASLNHPPRTAENVQTIEFETIEFLKGSSQLSDESLVQLLEYLKTVNLTKLERLQIVNLIPRSPVELYLIIEECDERFKVEEVEAMIEKINEIIPLIVN